MAEKIFGNIFEDEQENERESSSGVSAATVEGGGERIFGGIFSDEGKSRKQIEVEQGTRATQQVATETPEKRGFFSKALNAGKKVVKFGLDTANFIRGLGDDAIDAAAKPLSETRFIKEAARGLNAIESGQVQGSTMDFLGVELLEGLKDPVQTTLNTEPAKKAISETSKRTSNVPLKVISRIQSIGNKTYEEAYSAWLAERNDPDNPTWQRFLFELQDTGVQTTVGALLSVAVTAATRSPQAGYAVSGAFYTALSADEQLQQKGEVDSVGNIAIDVVGDQLLNRLMLNVLGGTSKSVLTSALKGFGVEGGTEVAQSLLKYSNDYSKAQTAEEKRTILDEAKRYVTSGGMAMEFFVGGTVGGLLTAGGEIIGRSIDPNAVPNRPTTRPSAEDEDVPDRGEKTPPTSPVNAEVSNFDITGVRNKVAQMEEIARTSQTDAETAIATRMRDVLNDYAEAFSNKTIFIPSPNTDAPMLEVETVRFPDGKVAVQYTANTSTQGFTVAYDYSTLFDSTEEATEAARREIIEWALQQQEATGESENILERPTTELDQIITFAQRPPERQSPLSDEALARAQEERDLLQDEFDRAAAEFVSLDPSAQTRVDDAIRGGLTIEEIASQFDITERVVRERQRVITADSNDISALEQQLSDTYLALGEVDGFPRAQIELENLLVEMELSETGLGEEIGDGRRLRFSTFPDWIPSELRRKALFEKVMDGLNVEDIQYPTGNRSRQRRLYQAIYDELDAALDVDTSDIRSRIIDIYDTQTSQEKTTPEPRRRRDERGERDTEPEPTEEAVPDELQFYVEEAGKYDTVEDFIAGLQRSEDVEIQGGSRNIEDAFDLRDDGLVLTQEQADTLEDFFTRTPVPDEGETFTIYRAVPVSASDEILIGDFVTQSREFAENEAALEADDVETKIITKEVTLDDLSGVNPDEFFYTPKELDNYASVEEFFNSMKQAGSTDVDQDTGLNKELVESIKEKFRRLSTEQLISRIEAADDFSYDDEAVELTRRLKEDGKRWKWSGELYNPEVIVIEENTPKDSDEKMQEVFDIERPIEVENMDDDRLNARFSLKAQDAGRKGEDITALDEYKEMTSRGYELQIPNRPQDGFKTTKKTVDDDMDVPSGFAQARTPDGDIWGALPEQDAASLPEIMGGIDEINAVELPEMVDLARELMGKVPTVVKKTGKASGRFYADPDNPRIKIIAEQFEQEKLPQAAKTLAHELGHLVDFLPDKDLSRGNLLSRLFTLRDFLKTTFNPDIEESFTQEDRNNIRKEIIAEVAEERDITKTKAAKLDIVKKRYQEAIDMALDRGGFIKEDTIREELLALTRWWHPYDPEKVNVNYRRYRESSVELYAEAISVLFNAPRQLQRRAPTFFDEFFKALDNKPDVRETYFELQALLSGDRELLTKRREEGIRRMFEEGDYTALELHKRRLEEREARKKQYWTHFKHTVIDKNFQIIDRVKQLEKDGKKLNPDENPVFFLEERNYLGGMIKAVFQREFNVVYQNLQDNEIDWNDFGQILFLQRVEAGDRTDVANPRGITPEAATELLEKFKKEYGDGRWQLVNEQADKFRAAIREISEFAYKSGLYTEELYSQMQQNPKYVSFQVLEHIDEGMTSTVYKSLGTLKDIVNPADSSMLKVISTIRAAERNRVARQTVNFLKEQFPEDIKPANTRTETRTINKKTVARQVPVPSRQPHEELVTFMEDGKQVGYYVDPYIAESINNTSVGYDAPIVPIFRFFNSGLFRPLFITFNLGFQSFNLIRDFVRFYKNIPDMTLLRTFKRYIQAGKIAKVRAFGLKEDASQADRDAFEKLLELEEERVLSMTFNDVLRGQSEFDSQVEKILADTGIQDFQPKPLETRTPKFAAPAVKALDKAGLLKIGSALLDFIANLGDMIETLPKAAGVFEFESDGELTADERSFIRRKVGSPDFLASGTYKPVTNEVFLFSNAIIQGIRSDIEVAKDPQTRAGWWWKTAKITFLPKILMFAAILGAFGDEFKELMEGASEYDRTNYTIIPLGRDTNGKPIYIRVPMDETSRFLGGIFWKAVSMFHSEKNIGSSIMEIASYTGGQLPSISPAIESISATAQFMAGNNPYDFFRGRPILSDDVFKAGGTTAFKAFAGWQFQQLGGGTFYRFYHEPTTPREEGKAERFFSAPIIGNILGRFVRVSDFGQVEQLRNIERREEQKAARRRLQERAVINEFIRTAQEEGEITSSMENDLIRTIFEGRPQGSDEKARAKRLVKKFRISFKRGRAQPEVIALIDADTNDEKLAILREIQEDMPKEEFVELRRDLIRNNIVSGKVFGELILTPDEE